MKAIKEHSEILKFVADNKMPVVPLYKDGEFVSFICYSNEPGNLIKCEISFVNDEWVLETE